MITTAASNWNASHNKSLDPALGPRYAEQKKRLDALHERADEEVPFVASFSAVEKEGGERVSYCVWGEGANALLPVTQTVAFMRHGRPGPVAFGSWERVLELAGHLVGHLRWTWP